MVKSFKTAIVLLNMGGPSCLEEIPRYLKLIFSDKDMIPLSLFQKPLSSLISRFRSKSVKDKYELIGGSSPLKKWTEIQCNMVCEEMNQLDRRSCGYSPYTAFRYSNPSIRETIEKVVKDKNESVVLFPQYPQFSYLTTGSMINELSDAINIYDSKKKIEWNLIDRWYTNEFLIRTHAKKIQKILTTINEIQDNVVIVFSAHSLPIKVVNKGDPYPMEVSATVASVMKLLPYEVPHILTWQSRVGPIQWLTPETSSVVMKLERMSKIKKIIIVPISFTSDHFETLYEIDIELKNKCRNPDKIIRSESLNNDELFITGLKNEIKNSIGQQKKSFSALKFNYQMRNKELNILKYLNTNK